MANQQNDSSNVGQRSADQIKKPVTDQNQGSQQQKGGFQRDEDKTSNLNQDKTIKK